MPWFVIEKEERIIKTYVVEAANVTLACKAVQDGQGIFIREEADTIPEYFTCGQFPARGDAEALAQEKQTIGVYPRPITGMVLDREEED